MVKRGRPAGLQLNSEAYSALASSHPAALIAEMAEMSAAQLSALRSGTRGANKRHAAALAAALAEITRLPVTVGALFPEAAGRFRAEKAA